jgi:hypothetical protein
MAESKTAETPGLTPRENAIFEEIQRDIAAGVVAPNSVGIMQDIMEEVGRLEGLTPTKRKSMVKRILAACVDHTSEVFTLQDDVFDALKAAAKQRFNFAEGADNVPAFLPKGPVGEVVAAMISAASDPTKVTGTQKKMQVKSGLTEIASRLFNAGLSDALVEYSKGSTTISNTLKQAALASASQFAVEAVASKCFGLCKTAPPPATKTPTVTKRAMAEAMALKPTPTAPAPF